MHTPPGPDDVDEVMMFDQARFPGSGQLQSWHGARAALVISCTGNCIKAENFDRLGENGLPFKLVKKQHLKWQIRPTSTFSGMAFRPGINGDETTLGYDRTSTVLTFEIEIWCTLIFMEPICVRRT
jgi:hypothetical protein